MKKILVGLAVLSAMVFAQGRGNNDGGGRGGNKNNQGQGYYQTLSEEEQEKLNTIREEHRKEMTEKNLAIQEYRIQIEKELLKDSIDWSKIEKLVNQEYEKRSEMELLRLQYRSEVREEFNFGFFDMDGGHHMNQGQHMMNAF